MPRSFSAPCTRLTISASDIGPTVPLAHTTHAVDRNLALLLAAVLVLAAIVIVVTSGESVAVRFLVIIVSLDIGARLIR